MTSSFGPLEFVFVFISLAIVVLAGWAIYLLIKPKKSIKASTDVSERIIAETPIQEVAAVKNEKDDTKLNESAASSPIGNYCRNCGSKLAGGINYCRECGHKVA